MMDEKGETTISVEPCDQLSPTRSSRYIRSTPSARRSFFSDEERSGSYIAFVESYFRSHPAARPYFSQLINFLRTPSFLQGQSCQAFELTTSHSCHPADGQAIDHAGTLFHEIQLEREQRAPRTVILRGFPSPYWIDLLGCKYAVKPEFFISHMGFSQQYTEPRAYKFYELPTIPSTQDNLISLRMINLGRSSEELFVGSGTSCRQHFEELCHRYQKTLFDEGRYGSPRWREVYIHDQRIWSYEQLTSFTVCRVDGDGGWAAIFLTDKAPGHDMYSDLMPGKVFQSTGDPMGGLPTIPYNLVSSQDEAPESAGWRAKLDYFHPLKHMQFADAVDRELFRADPFYLYSSTLRPVILSWNQLVNYVEEEVDLCRSSDPERLIEMTEHLKFSIDLMYTAREYLRDHAVVIRRGGCKSWPKATGPEIVERKRQLRDDLQEDMDFLVSRCDGVLNECQRVSDFLVSSAQLHEAQKSIEQASQIHALTRLAFVFVPLNLLAAVLSMQVKEFQESAPRIYVFFGIAALVVIVALLNFGIAKLWKLARDRTKALVASCNRKR